MYREPMVVMLCRDPTMVIIFMAAFGSDGMDERMVVMLCIGSLQ